MNGVGVTALKKRQDRKHQYVVLQSTFVESVPNIACLNAQRYREITGRCATIDPKKPISFVLCT